MPFNKRSLHVIILAALGAIVLIMGVLLIIAPAAIYPDPSWGFQVLRDMQMGSGFNLAVKTDQTDIRHTYTEFLSWWSPGQYLVPYLFKSIFGVNTGQASAITTILFSFLGLGGFYVFFKKVGFTPLISAVSVAFIFAQQSFFTPYVFYNGGELLIFGFAGWFLYGCASFEKANWKLLPFLLLSAWIGFFCKSSFIWMYAAGCIYLWTALSWPKRSVIKTWIINGIWIAIPSIIALATIYKFYLSKGANPASDSLGIKLTWATFSFPLASPILAGFSVDELANGLLFNDNTALFNATWALIIVLICAVLSVLLVIRIVRSVPNKKYLRLLVVFYSFAVLFFGQSFLRQLNISYEARHLRIIGLLITPGVIYLVSQWAKPGKVLFAAVGICIAISGFKYYIPAYYQNATKNARGNSGIAQLFIDQPALNYVMDLDKKNSNAIFVFISADIGLEVLHNRIITLNPIGPDVSIDYDDYEHLGHAGPLFMMLPTSYLGPKSNILRKCFPGYTGFHMDMLSNNYVLFSAK